MESTKPRRAYKKRTPSPTQDRQEDISEDVKFATEPEQEFSIEVDHAEMDAEEAEAQAKADATNRAVLGPSGWLIPRGR